MAVDICPGYLPAILDISSSLELVLKLYANEESPKHLEDLFFVLGTYPLMLHVYLCLCTQELLLAELPRLY